MTSAPDKLKVMAPSDWAQLVPSIRLGRGDLPKIEVPPDLIRQVISDILSADAKADDAPCSAESHLDRALVLLRSLLPDWQPENPENRARLIDAEAHMQHYLPIAQLFRTLVNSAEPETCDPDLSA